MNDEQEPRTRGDFPADDPLQSALTDEYKIANRLLPQDDRRIAIGMTFGWTEPSRNTLSGRLAGVNPESGIVDVWPEFPPIGSQVYDLHLQRYRTVIKHGAVGGLRVKDGDEVGTWLDDDEYMS